MLPIRFWPGRTGNRDCHETNTVNPLGWGDDCRDRIDRAGDRMLVVGGCCAHGDEGEVRRALVDRGVVAGSASEPDVDVAGAVARKELDATGRHQSLGAALMAARHAVEKIDPGGRHARGAEYFAANPGQQLRAWFSGSGVELASGIPTLWTDWRTERILASLSCQASIRTCQVAVGS